MEAKSGGNFPPWPLDHIRAARPICFMLLTQLIRCALSFQTRGVPFGVKIYQQSLILTVDRDGIVTDVEYTESGER
jgi:hypothetical protein